MNQLKDYLHQASQWLSRQWQSIKGIELSRHATRLGGIVDVLRIISAGLLQLVLVVASGICAVKASRLAFELRFYDALSLLALCAMLVGIALLTDYYTSPRDSKHGGGG